jgi:hypothetical protein
MNKTKLIIVTALISCISQLNAQLIDVGPDISVCAGPVTLTATIDSASIGSGTPTQLVLTDDQFSGIVNIGFPFTFYGTTYTQCVISSNNYVTFDLATAGQGSAWTIVNACPNPNPSGGFPASPLNAVMGPWQDILPPSGGTVSYQTLGTAPNRVFVVEYCNVPMFNCVGLLFSSQIVLREGSNEIETHIINKPVCAAWNTGQAIHGLHNFNGTIAHIVPGRNAGVQWATANEGYSFVPINPTTYSINPIPFQPVLLGSLTPPIIEWFIAGNPVPIDTGASIVVNPSSTTTYVARITGTACSGLAASDTMVLNIGSPVPAIVGNNSYCGADSVQLSTSQPYLSYLWSTGETTPSIYVTAGTYTVYVTGPGGCDSTSAPFTVTANANPNANLNLPPFCLGDPINIDASASTPLASIIAFHFDLDNNGVYEINTPSPIYNATSNFPAAGNYPIRLVTEGSGGCMDTLFGVVQIYNNPTIGLTVTDPTVCLYDDAAFQALAFVFNAPGQTSSVSNYAWDFDFNGTTDASGAGLTDVTHFFPGLGTYPVVVTVTTNVGCDRTDTVNVTIVDVPQGNIVAPQVCGNEAALISFNNTGLPINSYSWNFGDLTTTTDISSNSAPTYQYPGPGIYGITLIAATSDGCIDTLTSLINIDPLPAGTIPNTNVCQGSDQTFTFTQTSTDSILAFNWNFANGTPLTSNLASPSVQFPFGGPINVTVIVTNQYGCSDTISEPFMVNPTPSANIGVYPICISRFTFDPLVTPNDETMDIDWNLGDGTLLNDVDTSLFNHIYTSPGDYLVSLLITDQFGCYDTATQVVHVDDSLFIELPNVLVQSSNFGNNQIDMGVLVPSFNLCIDYTFTIFDRWGVQVFQTHNDPYNPDLYCDHCFKGVAGNGATLTQGIYFYVLQGNFNIIKSGSITIFE